MSVKRLIVIVISVFLSSSTSYAQSVLYGAAGQSCDFPNEQNSLFIVNPVNADTQLIGPVGFDGVTGLAQLGDGRVVASASNDSDGTKIAVLIEIDLSTGQGTLIGQIGDETNPDECGRVPDITYNPVTNTLYGSGKACNVGGEDEDDTRLLRINHNTGQGTIIGNTGIESMAGNGLAMSPDGRLFLAGNAGNGGFFTGGQLFSLNPDNAQIINAMSLVPFNFPSPNGMDFNPVTGVLFASDSNFSDKGGWGLETINTLTALITPIGSLPDCFDALAFVKPAPRPIPALSKWGSIAIAGVLALVSIFVIRKRRLTVN